MRKFGISFHKGEKSRTDLRVFDKCRTELEKKKSTALESGLIFFWGLTLCSSTA